MGKIGVTKLADTPRAETLAQVAGKLAQDCHKDTRHCGQEMVKMMLSHPKFKRLLEKSVSTRDLEDILTRIKKKEMESQKGEGPSVKMPVKKSSDSSKKPQATLPSSKRVKSTSEGRLLHRAKAQVTLPPSVEETEPLQKLYDLLEAKGFQTRLEGLAFLLELCQTRPQLISTNIVQVCRVSSLFLSFSSFPKPGAVKFILCVLALHPGSLGQAGPSYTDKFHSDPGFRTSSFSPAVFVGQVPIDAVHQMMTEFAAAVADALSCSQLG
ncbi:TOG array regulator of axonemal microtubules protein 2-like [Cyanistes caeruleus]|uniref:TOG array regulator of axonemal microtubules protein 2-like n=1 Tax=Cyanistes caeruleus TaxID=156563 RepID=UPI000CDA88FD|nr:TOG array regulator of axonemal microtubules protein 2-like [Cyanistes caeruleus]